MRSARSPRPGRPPGLTRLKGLSSEIAACTLCPRLVAWREEAARNPPARFREQAYWAKPISGFGDPAAWLLVVGLAPAAHGGNRTGRVFTGDRSGDFLFASLNRTGFANQALSRDLDDGLSLTGVFVTAAARCAPPDNRPTREEFATCRPWLEREIALLPNLRVVLALGGLAWDELHRALGTRPVAKFRHGAESAAGGLRLLASYHVSQQNTFTGRLTEEMLDGVFSRAITFRAPS